MKVIFNLSYVYISYVHKNISMKSTAVLHLSFLRTFLLLNRFFSLKSVTLHFQIYVIVNILLKRNILYNLYISCSKLRWNNAFSQNGWLLIKTTFRFIKRILWTEKCILLHRQMDKVSDLWSVDPEFESQRGFCC